jgi:DNA-binding transcriptional ArsR family regulator
VTGETQLRARRTRIKILRAIAEKNGSAGFSDIRNATSLSTGSIYYHLERMRNYINKASKHYSYYSSYKKNERPSSSPEIQSEGTIRQTAV